MIATVACVYRSGGQYDPLWVGRLRDAVSRHMSDAYRFTCLTDLPLSLEQWGIDTVQLRHNWPGYWSKLELFRSGLFDGPVLYIDLDSLIVGDLDYLLRDQPGFTMVSDFIGGPKGWHNSSVMSWWGDYGYLYEIFATDERGYRDIYDPSCADGRVGDQAFIEDVILTEGDQIDLFDGPHVVSYKHDARKAPPPDARIVQFHGQPKMPNAEGWALDAWQS